MKARSKKYFIKKQVDILVELGSKYHCFEFPHFGARYPDATCIYGRLYDLDSCDENGNLYGDGNDPCPACNTREYVEDAIDNEVPLNRIKGHLTYIFNKYSALKSINTPTI